MSESSIQKKNIYLNQKKVINQPNVKFIWKKGARIQDYLNPIWNCPNISYKTNVYFTELVRLLIIINKVLITVGTFTFFYFLYKD